jgi:hypothetical protein
VNNYYIISKLLEKAEKKANAISLAAKEEERGRTARDTHGGIEEKPFFLTKTIIS